MKPLTFPILLLVGAAQVHFAFAQTVCNVDTGSSLDNTTSSDSSNGSKVSSSSAAGDGCNGNPECETQLANIELENSAQLGAIAQQGFDASAGVSKKHKRQSDYTCSDDMTCYIYQNAPFCINMDTGDFTDESGGSGNFNDGTYTPPPLGNGTAATTVGPNANATSAGSTGGGTGQAGGSDSSGYISTNTKGISKGGTMSASSSPTMEQSSSASRGRSWAGAAAAVMVLKLLMMVC